jgi:hypothetical protein
MWFELKKEGEILSLQADELIGADSLFSKIATDAAIIRSVLWLDSEGSIPIHTSRILNQALKFYLPDSTDSNPRENLKECLEKLTYSGDLISFSEGRWLPAALKEILIDPNSAECLLVGGVPTNSFPKSIRKKIIHHKQYRKISGGLINEIYSPPQSSLTTWAKIPTEDLESWAIRLRNIDIVKFSADKDRYQHEVYIPQMQNTGYMQKSRWKQQFGDYSGRFLCKWKQLKGISYHIAELKNGKIIGLSNSLPKRYYSRFMYAEDILEGKNIPALIQIINDELIVKLFNFLPIGEYMIFDALGELGTETNDFLVWRFSIKYQSVIFETLQRLKIDIKEN